MRDELESLLRRASLVTIAAAIALGYALLNVAQGVSTLVLSIFTEQDENVLSGGLTGAGGPLSLQVGGRILEFAQLVSGVVALAVVLGVILYVLRPDRGDTFDEEPSTGT